MKCVGSLVQQIHQILPDNVEIPRKAARLAVEKALCALKPLLIPLLEALGVHGYEIQQIEIQCKALTTLPWSKTHTEAF